jgi:TM2 domain-containing membrane protein YozV
MSDNNQPPVPPQDPSVPPQDGTVPPQSADAQPSSDATRPASEASAYEWSPNAAYGEAPPTPPAPGGPDGHSPYGQAPQPPAPGEVPQQPSYDPGPYQQAPQYDPGAYPQQNAYPEQGAYPQQTGYPQDGGYGGYTGGPGYGQAPGGYNPNLDPNAKSRVVAGILGILLGAFGVHRFYLGYTGIGIAMVCITVISFGTLAIVSSIWGLIEGIMILTRSQSFQTDASGRPLRDG